MNDEVNRPDHYNKGGIQVIDVIETYAKTDFRLANVLKYVCRCEYKGKKLQDLEKAQWYLNRAVEDERARIDCEAWEADPANAEWTGWPDVGFTEDELDEIVRLKNEPYQTFHSSLATRIAGEDDLAQKLKDDYYKFDRYEIQGYCANCDAEIAKGQPFIKDQGFEAGVMFCKASCVQKLKEWQGR